jgi:hypothetical protein
VWSLALQHRSTVYDVFASSFHLQQSTRLVQSTHQILYLNVVGHQHPDKGHRPSTPPISRTPAEDESASALSVFPFSLAYEQADADFVMNTSPMPCTDATVSIQKNQ